jgi:ornithine decarboxylase
VQVHYNNPIKSYDDIATAYGGLGVRSFALDDCMELAKLRGAVARAGDVEASVRFRLSEANAWYDFGTKFGATPREAITLLRWVAAAGFKPSLAFHPGSQCSDPGSYARHIETAGEIAREARVRIHRLNVGGGFPVSYRDCHQAVEATFGADRPALLCEPGRAMAAPTTSLLVRVIHRRANGCLFLNDGIYGGLMEQLLVPLRPPARAWRDGEILDGPRTEFTVFGPTCDSADRLPEPVPLPEDMERGDWIEFGMAGAYGSATATRFNGFRSERYVQVRRGFPTATAT